MTDFEKLTKQAIEATNKLARAQRIQAMASMLNYITMLLLALALSFQVYIHYQTRQVLRDTAANLKMAVDIIKDIY